MATLRPLAGTRTDLQWNSALYKIEMKFGIIMYKLTCYNTTVVTGTRTVLQWNSTLEEMILKSTFILCTSFPHFIALPTQKGSMCTAVGDVLVSAITKNCRNIHEP